MDYIACWWTRSWLSGHVVSQEEFCFYILRYGYSFLMLWNMEKRERERDVSCDRRVEGRERQGEVRHILIVICGTVERKSFTLSESYSLRPLVLLISAVWKWMRGWRCYNCDSSDLCNEKCVQLVYIKLSCSLSENSPSPLWEPTS